MERTQEAIGKVIEGRLDALVREIADCQYNRDPEIWRPFGKEGLDRFMRKETFHLQYLVEAITSRHKDLFADYVLWARNLFAGLNLPADALNTALDCTERALIQSLPGPDHAVIREFIEAGRACLGTGGLEAAGFLTDDAPLADLARSYLDALLAADRHRASRLILHAVDQGVPIRDIYLHVFQVSQYEIGRLWQANRVSVAQEHFCTAATQMIMSQLYPRIFSGERNGKRLVAACVGGELHEIGIRMVADFFEMAGWDTYYLGANTPADSIVQTVMDQGADVIGISATMTFHVRLVADLIARVRDRIGDCVAVLVGGYPFRVSPTLWKSIGADGFAEDASAAIAAADALVATA